jgi:hypothetical protein
MHDDVSLNALTGRKRIGIGATNVIEMQTSALE